MTVISWVNLNLKSVKFLFFFLLSIENVYCGVPTVADDLLFPSRSIIDLQAILSA